MANTIGRNQEYASSFRPGAGPADGGAVRRTRARRDIGSAIGGAPSLAPAQGRRLSPEERRSLRERRRSLNAPPPAAAATATPEAPALALTAPTFARRPAPRMPRSREGPAGMPRGLIAIGAILIAGLAVLALAGDRLFGSAGDGPSGGASRGAAVGGAPPAASPGGATPAPLPQLALVPPVVASPPSEVAFGGARAPIVCLDPGHGGPDSGFGRVLSDAAPDMVESILVLQHAWDLEARLELRGLDVVMTRRDDVAVNADLRDVNGDGRTARDDRPDPEGRPGTNSFGTLDELQARINVCNDAKADLLVSMHVNGYSTAAPRGHETWFTRERPFGDRNYDFAARVYRQLSEQLTAIGYELPDPERGVLPDTTANVDNEHSMLDHFVMTGPDVPERKVVGSRMPGAIVETLFISSEYDAPFLASPAGRAAIVTAYENAIVAYFDDYPPDAG